MAQKVFKALTTFLLAGLLFVTSLSVMVPSVLAENEDSGGRAKCLPGEDGNLNLFSCFALNSTQNVQEVYTTPGVLINLLVRYAFIGAGMIIFVMIVYSGFLFISDDAKGKDQAKQILSTAGMGFIIMFAAYWILQIIKLVTKTTILI